MYGLYGAIKMLLLLLLLLINKSAFQLNTQHPNPDGICRHALFCNCDLDLDTITQHINLTWGESKAKLGKNI